MHYKTYYCVNCEIEAVAHYVDRILDGVARDQIVSISYAHAIDSGGPSPTFFYSVIVVVRREDKDGN